MGTAVTASGGALVGRTAVGAGVSVGRVVRMGRETAVGGAVGGAASGCAAGAQADSQKKEGRE